MTKLGDATPGPWRYRPNEFDDWGWIRGAEGDGPLAAIARGGEGGKSHEDHRREGTDPYAANARLIVEAVNSYPSRAASKARIAELESVVRDTIEALERNSTSAPVVECLKAALPVKPSGGVDE